MSASSLRCDDRVAGLRPWRVALLLKPRGWLGWLHLPVVVFVWLYSGAWGDLPLLVVDGEMMSSA